MAIMHCRAQMICRSKGRSAVAAAAYRAGEELTDERQGMCHNYSRRKDVVHKNIMAPENTPAWAKDRQRLWNEVEHAEKRSDSQVAREFTLAMPIELTREEQILLLEKFTADECVKRGMVADIVIHDKGAGNPHAHVLLTTRDITPEGFGLKRRDWNPAFAKGQVKDKDKIIDFRASWAEYANAALEKNGIQERIDHRSFAEREIQLIPTIHEGPHVRAMEERGIDTEVGQKNRDIQAINQEIRELAKVIDFEKAKQSIEIKKHAAQLAPHLTQQQMQDIKAVAPIIRGYVSVDRIDERIRIIEEQEAKRQAIGTSMARKDAAMSETIRQMEIQDRRRHGLADLSEKKGIFGQSKRQEQITRLRHGIEDNQAELSDRLKRMDLPATATLDSAKEAQEAYRLRIQEYQADADRQNQDSGEQKSALHLAKDHLQKAENHLPRKDTGKEIYESILEDNPDVTKAAETLDQRYKDQIQRLQQLEQSPKGSTLTPEQQTIIRKEETHLADLASARTRANDALFSGMRRTADHPDRPRTQGRSR